MRISTRSALYAGIAAMAVMTLIAAGSEALSAYGLASVPVWHGIPAVAAACVLGVVLAGWIVIVVVDGLFDDIERLRAAALTGRLGAGSIPEVQSPELSRMAAALAARCGGAERDADANRLSAVLAAFDDPILSITDAGQISLINGAAKTLLGKVALGGSLMSVLDRATVLAVLGSPEGQGWTFEHADGRRLHARSVPLPEAGGAVLRFASEQEERGAGDLEHDLRLHDRPPSDGFHDDTPLDRLPALVFDSETTGLDVQSDRIVALGGIRLHGARGFPATRFEELVRPDIPIPPRSTAIHGIGDAMVRDAPTLRQLWPQLRARWDGAVLVGHNIGFDIAVLRAEARRAALDWNEPPYLCTLLLAAALWPEQQDLNLEALAARLLIDTHGRHTALGDALVTAAIWSALIPLLADAGVRTLADARAFAERAGSVRRLQRTAGW
ncbi:MAG: exonuclease domain-containing protein [Alphaproteobacteria bacterium]